MLATEYIFQVGGWDHGPGKAAAAAALLPWGCTVFICGDYQTEAALPAAAEVAEALVGREIKRLSLLSFGGVGPRLARAVGQLKQSIST